MTRQLLPAVITATLVFPSVAVAQVLSAPAGVSVGAAVGYNTLSGDDFTGTDAGFGFQGLLRYTTIGGFAVSGGVQYNIHGADGISENLKVLGIYVEPRYVARLQAASVAPFVGGRVGWERWSVSAVGATASATGYGLGGIGGILFQVAPQVGIETAVTFTALSFGDAEVNNITVSNSDSNGSSLGLHAGIIVSFPSR